MAPARFAPMNFVATAGADNLLPILGELPRVAGRRPAIANHCRLSHLMTGILVSTSFAICESLDHD